MLTVHHIYKSYGIQPVLEDISFSISSGDRIGLIGPNGSGKTTLLRILARLEAPDAGSVIYTRPNLRVGYLSQGGEFPRDATLGSFLAVPSFDAPSLEREIERLAAALAADPGNPALQSEYDAALNRLARGARHPQSLLQSLGLGEIPLETPVAHLSGGQKTRLLLAHVLLEEPDLLLLDEPTNHLDIEMLEWLEAWLHSFPGAALIVSHDRAFLDHIVASVLELNEATHTVRSYMGNYSDYLTQVTKEREKQAAAYQDQRMEIRRMRQDIARTKEQARHVEITTTPRTPGVRRIAKKVAIKAKAREKKLERFLESDERVERPVASWQMKLEFEQPEKIGKDMLTTERLSVGYATDAPLLSDVNLRVLAGQRIAVIGPNGAGKTALMRTLAGRLEPLAGKVTLGASARLGYMAQEQELLDPDQSALEAVQAAGILTETEARNFLHYFLFEDDDPLRPARALSFGERARLQLALLVAGGCNLLLLDEPVNHLDIPSRARFEQALRTFKGTVIAVVHDRYFIERFASTTWKLKDGRLLT